MLGETLDNFFSEKFIVIMKVFPKHTSICLSIGKISFHNNRNMNILGAVIKMFDIIL